MPGRRDAGGSSGPSVGHAGPPPMERESESRTRWSQPGAGGLGQCAAECPPGRAILPCCVLRGRAARRRGSRDRTTSRCGIALPHFFPGVPPFHTLCASPDTMGLLPPLYVTLLYSMEFSDSTAGLSD